jgi:hypothetical protein
MDTRFARATGANPRSIAGKYFHSGEDQKSHLEGQVVSEISNGHFLVQLYGPDGRPNGQRVFHVARMVDWQFYNTRQEWLAARGDGGAA